MKKNIVMKALERFLGIGLLCFLAVGFTACNDNGEEVTEKGENEEVFDDYPIYDFVPIEISIAVETPDGKDLLNPETEGNLAGDSICAVYKGESYWTKEIQTRFYPAKFYGLYWGQKAGKHVLTFGEFQGEDTFENESFTIRWADGKEDLISFSSNVEWVNKEPVITRSYALNGTTVVSGDTPLPLITIVRN